MKTNRENQVATSIFQAGKMLTQPGLALYPEAEYGVDGRRCDVRFESANHCVFMEIFAGKDLSYMRDRLLMRDSRIFNRRLGKKGQTSFHLICNDDAFRAFNGHAEAIVEQRLVSIAQELNHYAGHMVYVLPSTPTKIQFRDVANQILSILGM